MHMQMQMRTIRIDTVLVKYNTITPHAARAGQRWGPAKAPSAMSMMLHVDR